MHTLGLDMTSGGPYEACKMVARDRLHAGALMNLKILEEANSLYAVPKDDLVQEVMIPALKASQNLRCMFGFFDSSSFSQLAPGLAVFVNETAGTMQLLVSPHIGPADSKAIDLAMQDPEQVLMSSAKVLIDDAKISEFALVRHHYDCLAYLLAAGRLEMRLVLMKDRGLFHPKVWLFDDGDNVVAAHGSSNLTTPGLLWNYETVSLARLWRGGDASETIERLETLFNNVWENVDEDETLAIELPQALKYQIIADGKHSPVPTIEDFWKAWKIDAETGQIPAPPPRVLTPISFETKQLKIPSGLSWRDGPFAHQGAAVDDWENADGRGILALATGAGKTVAALIAATRLQKRANPLLVVIAAPYRPLIAQWEDEVRLFDVEPVPLSRLTGKARTQRLADAINMLRLQGSAVEVLVITHNFLRSNEFRTHLAALPKNVKTLLIADEVHNLGSRSFLEDRPERFDFRLGLSATPERQYDPEGTAELFDFFGPVVSRFELSQAIGVCLVPYDYHLHRIGLDSEELDEWLELTNRLRKAGFLTKQQDADDGPELSADITRLLVKRRAVVENAQAKIGMLQSLLEGRNLSEMRHTLIYTSDKRPQQIIDVNVLLNNLRVIAHQFTSEETSSKKKARSILSDFAEGSYQVLTCKRVLDEGVNIPQVTEAFLLASNTVERQWVQRRGRLLRRCQEIKKDKAVLHDFIVVPPDDAGPLARSILSSEIVRAQAFAALADNAGRPNGPFDVIEELLEILGE